MSQNELILIIVFILLVFIPSLLIKKLPLRTQVYIRGIAGVLLITYIWIFSSEHSFGPKIILTLVAIGSVVATYRNYQQNKVVPGENQ